jgi:acetyl-CoA decarbonylase/synthase complex subunit gamma
VGNPDNLSPVLVSANYKMSFDRLRSSLSGVDAWILVIDTRGINVWCSAGKGTFCAGEIVRQLQFVGLKEIVSHRRLILPQLSAPGVDANEVRKLSGFRVKYGPVWAADIKTYLASGLKATPKMRRVKFGFMDRLVLTPAEIVQTGRKAIPVALALLVLAGLGPGIFDGARIISYGLPSALFFLIIAMAGAVLPPLLLPYLPGRALSLKGLWIGLLLAIALGWMALSYPALIHNKLAILAWLTATPAIVSFLTLNFTGCTSYTSLSGVLKEMKIALPLQIGAVAAGTILWIISLFV